MSSADGCVFCAIVRGDAPATILDQDERTVTFMDINPATSGHALVVPRVHSQDLLEIAPEDLSSCVLAGRQMAARMVDRLGADGVNLLNSCGAAAWQTVFHFHLHVVPRYAGDPARDSLELPWVPTPGDPDDIAAAAGRLSSSG